MVEGFYAWMVAGVVYVVDSTDAMVRIIFRSRYVRKSAQTQNTVLSILLISTLFVAPILNQVNLNLRQQQLLLLQKRKPVELRFALWGSTVATPSAAFAPRKVLIAPRGVD